MLRLNIDLLIIAGDLFDKSRPNYAEFERIYKDNYSPKLTTAIIPGNHDPDLSNRSFSAEGLVIHNNPILLPLNKTWKILFTPYQEGQTMGGVIAPFADDLKGQRWILVGHGDWSPGVRAPDPYEPGVYMPLTRGDIKVYKPEIVFLGHIHTTFQETKVHYPGSPCPVNVSETGLRHFLLLDLNKGTIVSKTADCPLLYFYEKFLMLPRENELDFLRKQMLERIKTWGLPSGWENRAHLKLKVSGISTDRSGVKSVIDQVFSPDVYAAVDEIDLNDLYHIPDPDRELIALKVDHWIKNLCWQEGPSDPSESEIIEEALKIIYGVS